MLALWVLWAILTLLVIGLALFRKFTAHFDEDDLVHLADGEANLIPKQLAVANKLDRIDSWGKTLTVVAGLFGLVLVSIMLFTAWQQSLQ
jgi:hypothetical protein